MRIPIPQNLKRRMKRLLPRTMMARSLLIIVTPVLLLQIIASFIFFDRHWTAMSNRLAFSVVGEVKLVMEMLEDAETPEDVADVVSLTSRTVELLITPVPGGKLDEPTDRTWWPSALNMLEDMLKRRINNKFAIKTYDEDKWFEILVETDDGIVRFMSPERRLYSSTSYIFILWLVGSAFVLFAIAIMFMRNQIRPIRRLATAAERFGRGLDVPAFKPEGASEVRLAAQAFMDMHDRIRRQIEQRTDMLAGVSHDLKTPLTRMKLQLAMLGDSPDTEALNKDIVEMEQMIEGYLAFARGEGDETAQTTDISKMLDKIADDARRHHTEINVNIEAGLFARVRPNAMERCIGNLVANACKYGEGVWMTAYKQGETIEINIDDDGPGIPEDKLDDVFKPFFRMESSRNPKTGGVGLGLAIAQDIAHSHGADILLEKSNRGGLRAVLRLPV